MAFRRRRNLLDYLVRAKLRPLGTVAIQEQLDAGAVNAMFVVTLLQGIAFLTVSSPRKLFYKFRTKL